MDEEEKRLWEREFKTPHRYGVAHVGRALIEKIADKRFAEILAVQMFRMMDPRLAKLMSMEFLERRTRETYHEWT